MKKITIILFILIFSGLLKAQSTNPDSVKYVSPAFVGMGGTKFFRTIQGAIDSSGTGTLINIYPGIYSEGITLKDGVNLYLFSGVKITRNTSNTISISSTSHYGVKILGHGIIENTGTGRAIYLINSSNGNNSNIYVECDKILSLNGSGIEVVWSSTNSYFNIKVQKIFAKFRSLNANLVGYTNLLELTSDSIYSSGTGDAALRTLKGNYNFNINYLTGNYTVFYNSTGYINYQGKVIRDLSNIGHCINNDGGSLYCRLQKIICNATIYAAVEITPRYSPFDNANLSFVDLFVQDTISNFTTCVNVVPYGSFTVPYGCKINAGYIINNSNSEPTAILYKGCSLQAKEIRNLGSGAVIYSVPDTSGLITVNSKLVGNTSGGIVTFDSLYSVSQTRNLILQNCVIYNANSSGYSVSTNTASRDIRIYGTLFSNVPRKYSVNFATGEDVQMYYVK